MAVDGSPSGRCAVGSRYFHLGIRGIGERNLLAGVAEIAVDIGEFHGLATHGDGGSIALGEPLAAGAQDGIHGLTCSARIAPVVGLLVEQNPLAYLVDFIGATVYLVECQKHIGGVANLVVAEARGPVGCVPIHAASRSGDAELANRLSDASGVILATFAIENDGIISLAIGGAIAPMLGYIIHDALVVLLVGGRHGVLLVKLSNVHIVGISGKRCLFAKL